ncbi:MAG: ABC transporter permease [Melioribacteraceae bacterium]|nr:ABC transporter permease [Melioribacteraceae bacterium]MCF8354027.1 ABC transporter permease [Melioribacteraceae bacterium]MCF8392292.1 ABC transporter permease [Melioribacteraceae bacterium]MCF8417624.1 ABC transporter permease [Melioribacteraceae bacterium]
MKLLLKLAWRNIWRNKRRSILTLTAITFATLSAVAMRGVQIGTYNVNIKNAVEMFSGYIQIQRDGYQKNPSLNKAFRITDEIRNALNTTPRIKSYTTRIHAQGLISFKDNSQGAAIFGIDPQTEKEVTHLLDRIDEGSFFNSAGSKEIVIGAKLLGNLNAEIGDTVVILSQGFDGALGNQKFIISGTAKFGSPEFDAMGVFMGIESANDLLSMYGNIHALVINLNSLDEIETVRNNLNEKISDRKLAVLSWGEVMPDLKQSIEFDNISGVFFLLILIVIVAFGILNTVLMSVTERFNEFGVTLSIGMPQLKLVYLVLMEIIFITIIGIVLGDIIGGIINYYIVQNPIELGSELGWIYEEYGFLPQIQSTMERSIFINTSITVFVISVLSSIYPLVKVYRLEPLKGIRYT